MFFLMEKHINLILISSCPLEWYVPRRCFGCKNMVNIPLESLLTCDRRVPWVLLDESWRRGNETHCMFFDTRDVRTIQKREWNTKLDPVFIHADSFHKWQCVKTLYPCSSHQNSWDLWMFIPLKMVFIIGIDPYPNIKPWPMANLKTHRGRSAYSFGRKFPHWRLPSLWTTSTGLQKQALALQSTRLENEKHKGLWHDDGVKVSNKNQHRRKDFMFIPCCDWQSNALA